MSPRSLFLSLLLLPLVTGGAKAQEINFYPVNHEVRVEMKEVDDIGFVLLLNGEKAVLARSCQWRATVTGGERGQASVNLRPHLVPGENILVIGCYNRRWDGPVGGKYCYDFCVRFGRAGEFLREYWSAKDTASDEDGDNVRKVVFAKAILVTVGKDGDVTLSQTIKDPIRGHVKLAVSELEKALLKNGDDIAAALPGWVKSVAEVVARLAIVGMGS